MVYIVVLTACASPEYRGQTVINRESIQISTGVASLVMDSDKPVVLEEDKRIICARTVVTGSRMPFTYCQTREEYEDYLRISQELIRNEQGTGVR
jgi:hypothetical protein